MKILSKLSIIIEFVVGSLTIGVFPFLLASFFVQVFIRLFYNKYWIDVINTSETTEIFNTEKDEAARARMISLYVYIISILLLLCPIQLAYDISKKIHKGESA